MIISGRFRSENRRTPPVQSPQRSKKLVSVSGCQADIGESGWQIGEPTKKSLFGTRRTNYARLGFSMLAESTRSNR